MICPRAHPWRKQPLFLSCSFHLIFPLSVSWGNRQTRRSVCVGSVAIEKRNECLHLPRICRPFANGSLNAGDLSVRNNYTKKRKSVRRRQPGGCLYSDRCHIAPRWNGSAGWVSQKKNDAKQIQQLMKTGIHSALVPYAGRQDGMNFTLLFCPTTSNLTRTITIQTLTDNCKSPWHSSL